MLDNICSLPLASDVFALGVHPTEPVFTVGLSAGHVQTFRLPRADDTQDIPLAKKGATSEIDTKLGAHGSRRRLSENGFDVVESCWRTRRHKGSCRTLAFSWDGETLYSAGTDGLVKAAASMNGRVGSKIAIEDDELPSTLCAPSRSILLLGTDNGSVLVYDLRAHENMLSSRPSQSFRPHESEQGPPHSEAITSITPLQPTSTSTSGESRLWITTSGSTLAASDLRKGVVSLSEDQDDDLLSSVCLSTSGPFSSLSNGSAANATVSRSDKVVVGGLSGAVMTWDRGSWEDRNSRLSVDNFEIEQLAAVPDEAVHQKGSRGLGTVAAGISSGRIAFLKIGSKGLSIIGDVSHDEGSVDGITALGFDMSGRMISCGGRVVKIWHKSTGITDDDRKNRQNLSESDDDDDVANSLGGSDQYDSDTNEAHEEASHPEATRRRNKKKRRSAGVNHGGSHGIIGFHDM